jgi:hypothetical protein
MMAHLAYTLLAGGLVSTGMAFSENRPVREQCCRAVYLFACCMLAVVAGSWIMRAIHG